MLLKNFRGLIPLLGVDISNNTVDIAIGLRATTGEYCSGNINRPDLKDQIILLSDTLYSSTPNNATGSAAFCIAFGTGDTPPTIDDYKLSGELVSTDIISFSNTEASYYPSYSTGNISFSVPIINDGTAPVTIKEIALGIRFSKSTNNYSIPGAILLTRDVLPEPVILNVGDSKVFEISIDTMSFVEQQVLQGDN